MKKLFHDIIKEGYFLDSRQLQLTENEGRIRILFQIPFAKANGNKEVISVYY